jgi:hypothetical protein
MGAKTIKKYHSGGRPDPPLLGKKRLLNVFSQGKKAGSDPQKKQ